MSAVAQAGAALLFNELPAICKLDAPARYRRLVEYLEMALAAAAEFRERQIEPSDN